MDRKKVVALVVAYLKMKKNRLERKKTRKWVLEWLGDYQRKRHSFALTLEPVLSSPENNSEFRKYVRIEYKTFLMLLEKLSPLLTRQDTNYRMAISPRERLSITLSFLAEGLSTRRLSYEFRVGLSTVKTIIRETIIAICAVLVPEYLRTPRSEAEWLKIINQFEDKWNFPACIGAMDGKHVHVHAPRNSGSFYYNYKEGFSIVLLALVDADYKFVAADVGANGKACDASVWSSSTLRSCLAHGELKVPSLINLPNSNKVSPPVIVADSGFQLEVNVMRPFPEKGISTDERVFNYRLSRARRVSENAFGILANRWRLLLNRMLASPTKATNVVLACCALHNMLRDEAINDQAYVPPGFVDTDLEGQIMNGTWRAGAEFDSLTPSSSHNSTFEAKTVRLNFKEYFKNEGYLSWQLGRIFEL